MRLGNIDGRCVVVFSQGYADIEDWSGGQFPSDPMALLSRWDEFETWCANAERPHALSPTSGVVWSPPVPRPRQVFAVASNYSGRVTVVEGSSDLPIVFTKFPSSIAAPDSSLKLPTETVDWEVELVVVLGRSASMVTTEEAWDAVAGVTVGQDFSERTLQLKGASKQFSLGKSYEGFGPIGPVMVTPDELPARNNVRLGCSVNGEVMQDSSTDMMIFSVPDLVSRLSGICELFPGDLIFTGTPGGMGMTMEPARYLKPGDVVTSWVEGIGKFTNNCVGPNG